MLKCSTSRMPICRCEFINIITACANRFGRKVASLVILADERADWRPCHFEEEILGCRVRFDFPTCKLLDVVGAAEAGSLAKQPSAIIILANWATQRTRQNMAERLRWKWDLTRRLYEAGFSRQDILELYRLLDWLMRLPEGLEREYKETLKNYEQSKVMPYVTSIERIGREEGLTEGRVEALRENIVEVLETRFGQVPFAVREQVNAIADAAQLKALHRRAVTCVNLAEFDRELSRRD